MNVRLTRPIAAHWPIVTTSSAVTTVPAFQAASAMALTAQVALSTIIFHVTCTARLVAAVEYDHVLIC